MSNIIDFENVSLAGLESSPVSKSLAGLRANESRYYKINKWHNFILIDFFMHYGFVLAAEGNRGAL